MHAKKPGPVGLHCIGGVIEHLPALTAIGCSTVNSYRRLWDQGFWAPVYADWGYQNRTCGLRVSAPGRFEYRAVDSMVNPYILVVGPAYGVRRRHRPQARSRRAGEPQHLYGHEGGQEVKKLPLTLGQALERLEDDEVIKKAMPDEMYRVFTHYKGDEWARFNAQVTEWDVAALHGLPALRGMRRLRAHSRGRAAGLVMGKRKRRKRRRSHVWNCWPHPSRPHQRHR